MQSRFVRADAEATVARYGAAGVPRDLALRVYTTRLLGVDPNHASLDWIGMKVKAKYLRNSKLKPTDVYFVPVEQGSGIS